MANFKKEIISRNFGRSAKSYEAKARLQMRVADELVSQCPNFSGRILDLGAGPGIIKKHSGWPNSEIVALDISFAMCGQAGSPVVNADMENLPFVNGSFDNVISSLGMQWADNFEKTLSEIHRVLKTKGRLAFSTFSPNSLKDLRFAFSYLDTDKHLMEFEPVIKIFAMLKKAGFDNLVFNSQNITYSYPDILSALRSIKDIGASYGFTGHKGLRTRKYFEKLGNVYGGITNTPGHVPLNWEVLYIHGEKA